MYVREEWSPTAVESWLSCGLRTSTTAHRWLIGASAGRLTREAQARETRQ